jgi:hypothetical protein
MGMMMALLLYNYPETAIRMTLVNTSRTVSLLIREAQIRGSAVDSGNTAVTESPIGGYGIYANLADPNHLILFSDIIDETIPKPYGVFIGNGLFDDETKSTTTFPQGYIIKKLCILPQGQSAFVCNNSYSPAIQTLTISFIRPNSQPYIYINSSKVTNFSAGCIELNSPHAPVVGNIRSVQVFNSGMIRSQSTKCD